MDLSGGARIHLDLNKVPVDKNDIGKVVLGIYRYARANNFGPPFIFTATLDAQDNNLLCELKNNNIRLVDSAPAGIDILFDDKASTDWPPGTGLTPGMRACIYIDWDNVQVGVEYIAPFLEGVESYICSANKHQEYLFYVFLHNKISQTVKKSLQDNGATVVNIIKDKAKSGDDEMFRFIQRNTNPGDSVCIASGDRDFSPLMIEYVRNGHDVFLFYNRQALYTFKNNAHWAGSVDIKSLPGVDTKITDKITHKHPHTHRTKPCKFYNLSTCNTPNCTFLHICGVCGDQHKMSEMHPESTRLKNTICKKYNDNTCTYSNVICAHLHICMKCKGPHRYTACKYIIMYCPLCKITMDSNEQFIMHQIDADHLARLQSLKKVITHNKTGHVLIV